MATEVPWSKDDKYPLPFDAFLFLTVLIPGALVLLLLPEDPGAVQGTILERVADSGKWHVYPAMVIASFVLGALADVGGRILREILYATALWTRLPTNKEIQEKLSNALSFDPHAAELTAANLWRHRTVLLTIAGQVPRGKAFRAYDRTLAMITNLASAFGLVAVLWCFYDSDAPLTYLPRLAAVGLAATALYLVIPRWWNELLFAASGIDMVSVHEIQSIQEQRNLLNDEEETEKKIKARTTKLEKEIVAKDVQIKNERRDHENTRERLGKEKREALEAAQKEHGSVLQGMTASLRQALEAATVTYEAEKETQRKIREAEKVAAAQALKNEQEASRSVQARLQGERNDAIAALADDKSQIQKQERQLIAMRQQLRHANELLEKAKGNPIATSSRLEELQESILELQSLGYKFPSEESNNTVLDIAGRQAGLLSGIRSALNMAMWPESDGRDPVLDHTS